MTPLRFAARAARLSVLLLWACGAAAQETPMHVELLIFEHADASTRIVSNLLARQAADLPRSPPPARSLFTAPATPTAAAVSTATATSAIPSTAATAYAPYNDPDDGPDDNLDDGPDDGIAPAPVRLLEAERSKLDADSRAAVLAHIAWRQPRYEFERALYIAFLEEQRAGLLKGYARVVHARFYELELQFLYDSGLDVAPVEDFGPAPPRARAVTISMRKVMEADKLYYLDHPLLGVLALITLPAGESPSPSEPEPAP